MNKDRLVNRLRGQYEIGPDGVYGERDFSGFIPPISLEAANRIEELENYLQLIQTADETVSEDPLALIKNICADAIGVS